MRWQYEPRNQNCGQPPKHKWSENRAALVYNAAGEVEGKCPSGISRDKAEDLLNSGISDSPEGWTKDHPKYIYNFHDGVVYKAEVTVHSRSYHGFPCRGGTPDMTARMKKRILAKAEAAGQRQAIAAWFDEHP